jgi:outer membrane protein assembly factor BamE
MFRSLSNGSRIALAATACAALSACGSFDGVTSRMASSITPYKVEVVQGNFISSEQVEALRPGMSRQQVRDILGTPLLTSVFHADRWDYVFTLKRQGVEPQARKLAVFFKGSVLDRFEGDTMPSEAEFVATLDKKVRTGKLPVLEASDATLSKFQGPPASAAAPSAEPPPANYPPLESPLR